MRRAASSRIMNKTDKNRAGLNRVTEYSVEIPHDRRSGLDPVSHSHIEPGLERKIDIQPRPKTDHAKTASPVNGFSGLNMADDPSGDQPGNLNHAEPLALVRNHENRVPFVTFRSLVEAGIHEFPRVILNFFNLALMGNAIDMDIKHRHEDADLLAGAIIKKGVVHFPGNDHPAVRRRDDRPDQKPEQPGPGL